MRSKNVSLSLVTSVIYQLVLTISNFILIGLIIKYYGSVYNGLNSSIQNVINYLTIIEAGIALSAIYALYKPLASLDWDEVNKILHSANYMYKKSGVVFAFFLVIVAFLYPLTLTSEINYYEVFLFILILGSSSLVEFFLNGKYRVLLMGDQKSHIVNTFQTLGLFISVLVKIYLIINGYSFLIVMLMGSLLVFTRFILSKIYINKKYKNLNFSQKFVNKYIFENKNSVIIHQISGLVIFNSPLVLVSVFLGLELASKYAIYNLIFNGIFMLIALLTKSSVSSFGNLLIKESNDRIRRVFYSFQSFFFIVGFLLFTLTFIMFKSFIHLYLDGDSLGYFDFKLIILFTMVGLLNMIRMPNNVFIEAAGHYQQTKYRALFEAIINIVFSVIFINIFAIYGALMGSIASFIYRSLDIILYSSKNILKISPIKSFYRIFINSILFIVILYTYVVILKSPLKTDFWGTWVLSGILTSVILGVVYFTVNVLINPDLYYDLKTRLNLFIKPLRRSKK
jgi:hypothetical protein